MMRYTLGILFLTIWIAACQRNANETNQDKSNLTNKTLLFIDKSASFGQDTSYLMQKYQEQIQLLLQSNMQKKGDQIEVFYVHDNTLKGKCLDLVVNTPAINESNLNPTDLESATLDFSLQIGKERLAFEKKILEALRLTNTDQSNQMTDLSATLTLMNQRNTGNTQVTAYFFSDMIESTRTGLDFHQKKPASPEESKMWASQEAEKYKDVNLQGISIVMVLPYNPMTNAKKK